MTEVREIVAGRTALAASALLALRPQWGGVAEVVDVVDTRLRPAGYRLVGVFDAGAGAGAEAGAAAESDPGSDALAVAGFREVDALAWGHHLYVDDVSTRPEHRGAGHADALVDWLLDEAARLGCVSFHLDSGVGRDREAAHRLYLRHHLRISAHHFQRDL